MRHLSAILAKAYELRRPYLFPCDLELDREHCKLIDEETPFLWILGEQGTRIVLPDPKRSSSHSGTDRPSLQLPRLM